MTRARAAAMGALAVLLSAGPAGADPYRLRADALAGVQSPVGLLTLRADGDVSPWLSAEALVWTGAGAMDADDPEADALVIAVKIEDPEHRGSVRLGRFVVSAGAVRPLHLDGVAGRARLPWQRIGVEAFAGVPVVPAFGATRTDWAAGGRVSRQLGDWGSAGVAYLHRREQSRLYDHEIGADVGAAVTDWLDLGARAALDLVDVGLTETHASVSTRYRDWRVEVFQSYRSPSRLLPATSLFSVIGDAAAQRWGSEARWRAAPRLDVYGTVAVRAVGDDLGADLSSRAVLRLDDRGLGALGFEIRRMSAPDAEWTGLRGTVRVPVIDTVSVQSELELVVPDDSGGRGTVWPWALVAASWQLASQWHAAAALEASSSPQLAYRFDVLARLSYAWEVPR